MFILFVILYWALFFPLLWIHTKSRVSHIIWITILIAALVLFLILVIVTIYLVKKYNWWMNLIDEMSAKDEFGFHQQQQRNVFPLHQNTTNSHQSIEMGNRKNSPGVKTTTTRTSELCEVIVDTRVLQDAETQTVDGSMSPGLYRTSLTMDVQPRSPRSPSGDSLRSSWFYPTLADYYQDKTLKLKVRLDKAHQEQLRLEEQEKQLQRRISSPSSQRDVADYSISDSRLFLKREQVYSNLEIR